MSEINVKKEARELIEKLLAEHREYADKVKKLEEIIFDVDSFMRELPTTQGDLLLKQLEIMQALKSVILLRLIDLGASID